MTSDSPKPKKIFFYVLIFFLMLPSVLILSEVMLRLSGRVATQGLHTSSGPVFDHIPGIFAPNQNFIYRRKPNLPFHISINSLGYRGSEFSLKKYPGAARIHCLGDSQTFGYFVNDDETFPYKLQELFEPQQSPVEVINGGVGGTTILDQLCLLKKSMEIVPDIVILSFSMNDISDLGRAEPLYTSFEKNRKLKSFPLFEPVYKSFRDTALFQLALLLKAKYGLQFDSKAQIEQEDASKSNIVDKEAELRKKYAVLLGDMNIYLKRHSIKFMFVIFPSHHQIGQRSRDTTLHDLRTDWLEKLTHEIGIPTVNLPKLFKDKNYDKYQLYLLPYDGHPSKLYYALAASAIFESLHKNFQYLFTKKRLFRK